MEGTLIGHWRVIRELGHGGMGTVYLAARADDEYEAQAAIKLVRRGLDTDFILHRFRHERQILARLEHPNIGRMFDGGTNHDGNPYFVMEYVNGLWITRYADQQKMKLEDRIRLCLPVCSAVAYAHRNFIVHRDLKPANILVDASGVPKLLDFGVSKLLHSDQSEAIDTGLMTPDYASPEQILGNPVTLASDVYSIGAVMYELLTGALPHQIDRCTAQALERIISQEPVPPPSVAALKNGLPARQLRGDLDSIILCAMEKDPSRRYASVDLLAEDLQRFLHHRPVNATRASFGHRINKFIRRNRVTVTLGASVAVIIVAVTAVEWQQARVAHQRFQDVRKLATGLIFDVEGAVRPLPGSTNARQLITRTGIDFLNSLSQTSTGDWALKHELASAWLRIGMVQGGLNSSNLGDAGAALVSFDKAGRLLDEVQQHDPSDPKAALDRVTVLYEVSNLQWTVGRYNDATASAKAGLRIAESRPAADAANPIAVQYTGLLHLAMARLRLQIGDLAEAESEAAAGARLLRPAAQARPENREAQLGLYGVDVCLGSVEASLGRPDLALVSYRSGVAVVEELCRRYPADTLARRTLMFAYGYVGDMLGNPVFNNLGDPAGAFRAYTKMAEQAKFLCDADSADARAVGDYGSALLRLGLVTPRGGPRRKETLLNSRALLYRAAATNPQNRIVANNITWVESELGDYPAAIAEGEKTLRGAPDDWSALRVMESAIQPLAEQQARRGQRLEALATLEHALHWATKVDNASQTSKTYPSVALAWQTAGSVYAILASAETGQKAAADRTTARIWYERAVNEWRKMEHDPGFIPAFAANMKADEQALTAGGLGRQGWTQR